MQIQNGGQLVLGFMGEAEKIASYVNYCIFLQTLLHIHGKEETREGLTDLEEHVVGCHAELVGVQHQSLVEQGEEPVTQHDL